MGNFSSAPVEFTALVPRLSLPISRISILVHVSCNSRLSCFVPKLCLTASFIQISMNILNSIKRLSVADYVKFQSCLKTRFPHPNKFIHLQPPSETYKFSFWPKTGEWNSLQTQITSLQWERIPYYFCPP